MTTVAQTTDFSKRPFLPTKHYAHLGNIEGIATLVPGGYVFRADDGNGYPQLVSYKSTELVLHGYLEDTPADDEPLWKQIASPTYYNGSATRGTLAGGR
jgi:hypothetical protein